MTSEDYTEFIKKMGPTENIYMKFSLSGNPFPARAIAAERHPDLPKTIERFSWEARKDEILQIHKKLIEPAYRDRESGNIWISGRFGIGKTAILIYIWQELRKREDIIALYSELGTGFPYVYSNIIAQLKLSFFEDLARKLAHKAVCQYWDRFFESNNDPTYLKIKDSLAGFAEVLKKANQEESDEEEEVESSQLTYDNVQAVTKTFLSENGITSPVRDGLVKIIIDSHVGYAVLTDKVPQGKRLQALADLIKTTYLAGYRMTYLFLDQLDYEYRFNYTKSQRDKAANQLKQFAIWTQGYIAIASTTYPDLINYFKLNYPQVLDALPMDAYRIIEIGPLTLEKAKILTRKYLETVKTKESIPDLFPFTEQSIEYICQAEGINGVPRFLLNALHSILKSAAESEKVKLIDVEFVKEHLVIPEEEEEDVEQEVSRPSRIIRTE
jgi:hypothetical protein